MEEQYDKEKPVSKEGRLWVVCCICNKVLQVGDIPGDKRTSHGLCQECSEKTLEEV